MLRITAKSIGDRVQYSVIWAGRSSYSTYDPLEASQRLRDWGVADPESILANAQKWGAIEVADHPVPHRGEVRGLAPKSVPPEVSFTAAAQSVLATLIAEAVSAEDTARRIAAGLVLQAVRTCRSSGEVQQQLQQSSDEVRPSVAREIQTLRREFGL